MRIDHDYIKRMTEIVLDHPARLSRLMTLTKPAFPIERRNSTFT